MRGLLIAAATGLFVWAVLAIVLMLFGPIGFFLALAILAACLWWAA